jgi:hypothetical protein
MATIKKINNNEILPNIEYTSIAWDNATDDAGNTIQDKYIVDVRLRIIPRTTSLDNIVLDKEYLKYIKMYFVTTQTKAQQEYIESLSLQSTVDKFINTLAEDDDDISLYNSIETFNIPISNFNQVEEQFEYFIDKKITTSNITDVTNTLTLNTFVFFDVESYFADNKLSTSYVDIFKTSFGTQEVYTYPLTEKNEIIEVLTLGSTGEPEDNITCDLRTSNFLIDVNRTIVAPTINNDLKRSYLTIHVGNDYQKSLKNYLVFDFGKFLIDKSCIDDNIFDRFTISLDVYRYGTNEREPALVDRITLFREDISQPIELSSINDVSKLAFIQNNNALIYFTDNILESTSEAKFYYLVEVKYTDKSFFSIYEPYKSTGLYFSVLHQYEQIKNMIYLANKNAYSKTETTYAFSKDQKPIPTVFFLDTDTKKFTQQFIEYYKRQFYVDSSTGGEITKTLDMVNFINNFANLVNKFVVDSSKKITNKQIETIINALRLSNASFNTYLKFFKSVDLVMANLAMIFSNAKQNVSKYVKKSESQNVEKDNTYFRLNEYVDDLEIPTIKAEKIVELFSASGQSFVLPKFYVDNEVSKIDNLLLQSSDAGSEKVSTSVMSRVMKKAISKKKKALQKSDETTLEAELLLLDLGVSFKEYKQKEIVKKADRKDKNIAVKKTIDSFQNKDLNFKTIKNKLTRTIEKQTQQNDQKRQVSIQSVNDVVNDILFTTRVPDIKYDNKFASPSIILRFYNFDKKTWVAIDQKTIKKVARRGTFFIEATVSTEGYSNIFKLNNVDTDLETRYFIMEP